MFEVFKGKDDQYYWRLKAANGEIVAQSEGYNTEDDARWGTEAVRNAVLGVLSSECSAIEIGFIGRPGGSPKHTAKVRLTKDEGDDV